MSEQVYLSFRNIIYNREKPKIEPMIEGRSGFLFLDRHGNPKVALHIEKVMQRIIEKHNKNNEEPLPRITPHILRHTFCSRMANARMNPKHLQYIMGHSDVGITLNVYTHINFKDAKQEMSRICQM